MRLRQAFGRLLKATIFLCTFSWSLSSWALPANMLPGYIYTLAGNGGAGFSGDGGPAINADISGAKGLAVDGNGNLYMAEYGSHRVRKITPGGIISTVAGLDNNLPVDVAVDDLGNLYVADHDNLTVSKVGIDGTVTRLAGNGTRGASNDGSPAASAAIMPTAVAIDKAGNLYIADELTFKIRKVTNGIIMTVAGTGTMGYSGDGGPAISAMLGFVKSMAIDSAGSLYLSDHTYSRIRKISNGVITTIAGGGSSEVGNATDVGLGSPNGIAFDRFDNLYIVTNNYSRNLVRKLSNGKITLVAGDAGTGDGYPAYSAGLYNPWGLAIDHTGNMYIGQYEVDRRQSNSYIRIVATTSPVSVLGLAILCPTTLDKNTSGTCTSDLVYSDGSSKPVSANWNSSAASAAAMSGNTINAQNVADDTPVIISADYTEGGVTKTARQTVMISSRAYKVTDVVPLEGLATMAYGVNNKGEVVGASGYDISHAFVYSKGQLLDLGLEFGTVNDGVPAVAKSINDAGDVVGTMNGNYHDSFLYSKGSLSYLRRPGAASSGLFANRINNNGQIVGYMAASSVDGPATSHAFLYSNGIFQDLGTLKNANAGYSGFTSTANGINDNGQVVGESSSSTVPGSSRAFTFSNGIMADIDPSATGVCSAAAVNNLGQITGHCSGRAFIYSNGSMTWLGTLNETITIPTAINNKGEIVGYTFPTTIGGGVVISTRPFLYSNGKLRYLDDLLPSSSGWKLISAWGINDAGQIVGGGIYSGRQFPIRGTFYYGKVAYLLNPSASAGATVSPGNLSLIEGGTAGTYTIVLNTAPSANVIVNVTPDAQLVTSVMQLTFTPANWNVPQTVSVQAILDGMIEGAHTGTVSHTVTSADPTYNGVSVGNVTASITDTVNVTIDTPSNNLIWNQTDLPVSGKAAPGAIVILTATNLNTGDVRAVNTVAAADGSWNTALTGLADGTIELQAESASLKSNKVTVLEDSHPPLSILSMTSIFGPTASGWYTGTVKFTISAVDGMDGQGVLRSEYTLDGGPLTTFSAGELNVITDGTHSLCYRSVDKANNAEAMRCVPFYIDATAPTVNPVYDPATIALTLNAQDAGSGLASVEISRDGGANWMTQSGPVTFDQDGSFVIQYRAKDIAGNLTTGQTTVTVATLPVITVPANQTANEGVTQNVTLGTFTDAGVDTSWNVDIDWGDGSAPTLYTVSATVSLGTQAHTYTDNGSFTVTIKVTDTHGNADSKSFTVTVANSAPTAALGNSGPANEGSAVTISFTAQTDPSNTDTTAGFHYAYACDGAALTAATYANSGTSATATCTYNDNGSHTVRARIIDKDDAFTEYTTAITVNNAPPTASLTVPPTVNEGGAITATLANPTDPSSADITAGLRYAFSCDGASLAAATYAGSSTSPSVNCSTVDGPSTTTVRARILDKDGGFTEYTAPLTVNNVAPSVGTVTAPTSPVLINTAVAVSASFTDPGTIDTHTAIIDWGDGTTSAGSITEANGSGTVSGSHSYAAPGFYTAKITVTDKDGGSAFTLSSDIVVYDPNAGFANGFGRIDSPAGAMPANPAATGQANLLLNVQYKSGSAPTGNVRFDFGAGNLNFQSTALDWMVVTGQKASILGSGTVNGVGGYSVVVTVIDQGNADFARIKIWNTASGAIVYDNEPGRPDTADPVTPVQAGNISVH